MRVFMYKRYEIVSRGLGFLDVLLPTIFFLGKSPVFRIVLHLDTPPFWIKLNCIPTGTRKVINENGKEKKKKRQLYDIN